MTPSKLISFKKDINKIIDQEEDFVCIIKLMNDNVLYSATVLFLIINNKQ